MGDLGCFSSTAIRCCPHESQGHPQAGDLGALAKVINSHWALRLSRGHRATWDSGRCTHWGRDGASQAASLDHAVLTQQRRPAGPPTRTLIPRVRTQLWPQGLSRSAHVKQGTAFQHRGRAGARQGDTGWVLTGGSQLHGHGRGLCTQPGLPVLSRVWHWRSPKPQSSHPASIPGTKTQSTSPHSVALSV